MRPQFLLARMPGYATAVALTVGTLLAAPAGPTPQIPDGGAAPGPFPNTSVTAVNVQARGSTTFNSSVDVPGLAGQGPIPWSVNRYNRGDIAVRLSPGNPTAALENLGQGFIEFGDSTAGVAASQAWRPSPEFGVILATARRNGPIDWSDGEGPFFPTIAISGSSSGPGYNLKDGSWGPGNLDINTGRAGTHASSPEANFDFSVAWFPYDQGWLGGDVAAPTAEGASAWSNPQAHAAGLTPGLVKWLQVPADSGSYGGLAELRLPGVNALEDGLLFTVSSDGSSDVNIVGVNPLADGQAWTVTIREDSATDAETLAVPGQSRFQFVYIPFAAERLIGGHIVGSTGAKRKAAGDFTVTRTGTGVYELTVPGKSNTDGTLLLQVADAEADTAQGLASRAFLSYEFANGKFIIQSRKTSSDTEAPLTDASFYVAWVDFAQPLALPAAPRLRSVGPVAMNPGELVLREAGVAASTHEAEVLVVSIDVNNTGGYVDPLTQQTATAAMVGQFHDARTLAPIGSTFLILANPAGQLTRTDVEYNPVTRQYVVASNARTYNAAGKDVVLLALVNPSASDTRVAKVFAHHADTDEAYDDIGLAVSTKNGNFLLVAERKATGEGESTVAALYSGTGALLTPPATRVDPLQTVGDEDDPDAAYLPQRDAFFYVSNTDNSNGSTGTLSNRVVGSLIDTVPGPGNTLVVRTEQPLGNGSGSEGHPFSLENPFNGQLVTAYDAGNGTTSGDLSFYDLGTAPSFAFSEAAAEVAYLSGPSGDPFKHQHPQLAADPASGTLLLTMNATGSTVGIPESLAILVLGPDGHPLTGQLDVPALLADSPGGLGTSANYHALTYSPVSGHYIAAYNSTPGVTYLAALRVTSSHLAPATPPQLLIQRNGSDVRLSWPTSATGFVLEIRSALGAAWTPANLVASVVDGNNVVTAPASATQALYRLRKP